MCSDTVSSTAGTHRDRKNSKPIMEKRRRARINASLAELKSLLLEAIKKEGSHHSKMEKADILELTVKHLRDLQRQPSSDPRQEHSHHLGFSKCTQEVDKFLSNVAECDVSLRAQLLEHLADAMTGVTSEKPLDLNTTQVVSMVCNAPKHQSPHASFSNCTKEGSTGDQPPPIQTEFSDQMEPDVNNNLAVSPPTKVVQSTSVFSGLKVIPSTLPTGEMVFLLPGSVHIPSCVMPVFTSTTTSSAPVLALLPPRETLSTCAVASTSGMVTGSSNQVIALPQPLLNVNNDILQGESNTMSGHNITRGDIRCSGGNGDDVNKTISYERQPVRRIHNDCEVQPPHVDTNVWRPW